ncbi:MAG: histidinol dehydrogenase [Fibrobacter sp.]|jgi:histidinol dehydrogenase|nr:histidinol dehydrogenase [Fibrobacter sp.]
MAAEKKIPILNYPAPAGKKLLHRIKTSQQKRDNQISSKVESIIDEVRKRGDKALIEFTRTFDRIPFSASKLRLSEKELQSRAKLAAPELRKAIEEAAKRIEVYHRKQLRQGFSIKTAEGCLTQLIRPLSRVGVYIPGGHTVYPSSVLMNVIPARVAGVKEIVAVTPPRDDLDPGVAYALQLLDVKEIYRVGGAQAIAALAYGTKTIRPVDKITGPGNAWVATAKRLVYGTVDIDSIAGPSEVAILADRSANPEWVALDLLSQAEHGSGDEIAVCVCESKVLASRIASALTKEITSSPVRDTFLSLSEEAISIFVTPSRKESIALINEIAPEHLQIMTKDSRKDLQKITNAAAIFLGSYTPVALGDYFVGTNHVLPTGGAARFSSPLGVDSFLKSMSVAEITPEGLASAAKHVSVFARSEKFIHHALSVERRTGKK